MHPFEKIILENCLQNQFFIGGERVVVGVSGGADSVALLHVLFNLSEQLGITLVVAHVNHGLRPTEAKREEELVRKYADSLDLTFHCSTVDVEGLAKRSKLSKEEAARNLRYSYFDEVMQVEHASKVCVGHHGDDQAEEVLLRLIRGAGRKGLSGMDFMRDHKIIRPLLSVSKSEIVSYLQDRSIIWHNDSSNSSTEFLRNKVRLELLPYLQEFNPNICQTLRRTSRVLKDEEEVLEEISTLAYGKVVTEKDSGLSGLGVLLLDLNMLNGEQLAIQRRVVEKALFKMKLQPSFTYINDILKLSVKKTGRLLHLPKGLRVNRNRTTLEISYPRGITTERGDLAKDKPMFSIEIDKPGVYSIPAINKEIIVELLDYVPGLNEMRAEEADFFDHQQLGFPFQVRNRLPGDTICPVGATGTKKVGRILSDLKMESVLRNSIPVIIGEAGIAGLLGVRLSQWCRIRNSTRKVLRIKSYLV